MFKVRLPKEKGFIYVTAVVKWFTFLNMQEVLGFGPFDLMPSSFCGFPQFH